MALADGDYVNVYRPRYCTFYKYPFMISYTLSLFHLVDEFCRFYHICPAQLMPYTLKMLYLLAKYAELAGSDVSVHHLLHLFSPGFLRGNMVHLRLHGTKGLAVRTDDRPSHKYWHKYFFIKTEHMVSNPAGFLEKWNDNCMYRSSLYSPSSANVAPNHLFYSCGTSTPARYRPQELGCRSVAPHGGDSNLDCLCSTLWP